MQQSFSQQQHLPHSTPHHHLCGYCNAGNSAMPLAKKMPHKRVPIHDRPLRDCGDNEVPLRPCTLQGHTPSLLHGSVAPRRTLQLRLPCRTPLSPTPGRTRLTLPRDATTHGRGTAAVTPSWCVPTYVAARLQHPNQRLHQSSARTLMPLGRLHRLSPLGCQRPSRVLPPSSSRWGTAPSWRSTIHPPALCISWRRGR